MWTQLAPVEQATWPDEPTYAAFLQRRFVANNASIIAGSDLGNATVLHGWSDLRFTSVPLGAVAIPVTLKLATSAPVVALGTPGTVAGTLVLIQDDGAWRVVDAGPADMQGRVLTPLHPVAVYHHVPILMYHHIAPKPARLPAMTNFDYNLAVSLTVPVDQFTAQLDWLQKSGYHAISPEQLMAAMYDGAPLPAHPILLTFDDGYTDNYTYAFPLLKAHGMVGTFNVITKDVGETIGFNQYMTWDEIEALAAAGMAIGSHTANHVDLGRVSYDTAWAELTASRDAITAHLGAPPQLLCYPSGEPFRSGSKQAQQRLLSQVYAAGYAMALLDPRAASATQWSTSPYMLSRIRVDGAESLPFFTQYVQYTR